MDYETDPIVDWIEENIGRYLINGHLTVPTWLRAYES